MTDEFKEALLMFCYCFGAPFGIVAGVGSGFMVVIWLGKALFG